MEYRALGRTGVQVSRLCFGTMSFGGDADEATSRSLFTRCREAGINFFDCADVYAGGKSETLLGKFMADARNELVIASKAHFGTGPAPTSRGSTRYHLVRAVEASLKRLNTDRIDILYLHHFDTSTALDDTLRSLDLLLEQGKILYPAASNFSAWQTMRALGIAERRGYAPLACLQPMYNLAKRQAEVEILPMAIEMGLGVCSYSPLAGGLLTGKYAAAAAAGGFASAGTSGRLATNTMYQARYGERANHDIAAGLGAIAREIGHHPASVAVAWVASHPGITAPILGARNLEQLEPSLKALDVPMTAELRERINKLSPTPPPAHDRSEEKR
ncbi:MAG: oxidoreductase, Aldo/keto reductase family [Pseudomonadota bacterium]|jgi:aryl-alcohol dehydrogenase-like predicted oxidoreductase